ncbi:MAG TPA: peptidase E, partial [Bacteroidales bacterium]|nr:peptidase E [Bacteroidales bacterium]
MERRKFITTTVQGSVALGMSPLIKETGLAESVMANDKRKILITGGSLNSKIIDYVRTLTGKSRPRICFLPTASADDPRSAVYWYRLCAGLEVIPFVQNMFISSYSFKRGWDEILLSMDAIIVGGGNTLNMLAIWKAQGIDKILKEAWDKGILLGGGSAGSLCWFEEGTTDSRPKDLTKIECLGFLKGSHSPHYDGEKERRPEYHKLIKSGILKPGYAVDNHAAIYFEDNEVNKVVATDDKSKAYYVDISGGEIKE